MYFYDSAFTKTTKFDIMKEKTEVSSHAILDMAHFGVRAAVVPDSVVLGIGNLVHAHYGPIGRDDWGKPRTAGDGLAVRIGACKFD